jgi:ABC-type uncharacterized transport system permease subunit
VLRGRVVERLAWIGALVTLATAAILLLGPLWDSAVGENPLERDPDPDITAILRLAMPTVIVAAAVAVALCAGRWRVAGGAALVLMGIAVWLAPSPLPLWFLPGLVVTAAGYVVALGSRARPARTEEPVRTG